MPISLNRTADVSGPLSRLSYKKGLDIKEDVEEHLASQPNYYFCADTLAARIGTSAHPVQIESVLSRHPDQFTYEKLDDKLYWQLETNN